MPVEHSVWLDLLSPEERAWLEPGLPAGLARRPDVLVVGGGIAGLATAAACRQAGLGSVVLIERGRLGGGASGGAAGMLIPETHIGIEPDWFVELGRQSLGLWRALETAWPGGVGLVELDWLGLEPLPAGLAANLPPGARTLDPDEVERRAPGLRGPQTAVQLPLQARVNPLRAVARLAAGLRGVASGVEATAVRIVGQQVVAVVTSAGEFEPGAVVLATGGPPRLDGLKLDLPARMVKGHLLATEPTPFRLPGAVAPIATQIEDDRLLIGSSIDPEDTSPNARPEAIAGLWSAFVAGVQPAAAARVRISHQWCCFRPWHPDGLPVIDRVPSLSNAWFTSGHFRTGVLMAALTGRVLAEWIATGAAPLGARGLAADRFAGPVS